MHKVLLAVTAAACLVAAPAMAQSHPFTGWSLGLNLDRATTATQFGNDAGFTSTLGEASHQASLQAAYGLALGRRSVLGLGLTLGLGEQKGGSLPLGGSELSFRMLEMYSLYAEPGHALGESSLLYGKLVYLGARGEESYAGETFSKTFAGIGYGAGVRTLLGERLYLQVEFVHADYEWKTARSGAFRPVSTTGSIGLGWRF